MQYDNRPVAISVWRDVTDEQRRDNEFEHIDNATYRVRRAVAIEPDERDPLTVDDLHRIRLMADEAFLAAPEGPFGAKHELGVIIARFRKALDALT